MKQKAIISQPMGGLTYDEIERVRLSAIKTLEANGYIVVHVPFTNGAQQVTQMEKQGVVKPPLCLLAKALDLMSCCHTAYFCKGWKEARGCRIEHQAAKSYGLEIIYED
jgi:hypothetical protein